jgi:ABC-2 type transport system ATP-binding protein
MAAVELAVSAHKLTKSYAGKRAVDDLDLDVRSGETVALLGPNGAGKTTTVEILEGYRQPDSGTVHVLGFDPFSQSGEMKSRIGVMLQEGGLYPAITPREALHLFAHFYPDPADPDALLEQVGLKDSAHVRYRRLSGGQKQRLSLALALLPNPDLVFLDEPTAGMDIQARRTTWDLLRGLKDRGVSVLLTTHYLEEAERLADRVAIIDDGRLIALDTPARLVGSDTAIRLRTSSPVEPVLLAALPAAGGIRMVADAYVIDTPDPPALAVQVATLLRDLNVPLVELRVGHGSLEDVFVRLTGQEPE